MTTTTTDVTPPEQPGQPAQPEAPVQNPFRMLAIRADLLPPEIEIRRRAHLVRRIVLAVLLLIGLLIGAWYGLANLETTSAEADVATAEADLKRTTARQSEFSELVKVRADIETIRTQLTTLLADDLQWSVVFSSVRKAAPENVTVRGVTGRLTGTSEADTGDSGEQLVGALTITGSGTDKQAVTDYVTALQKVRGLGNPLLRDAREQEEGGVEFTVNVDITESARGGRYSSTPKTATPAKTAKPAKTTGTQNAEAAKKEGN
ncbi:PilN domain-containing protein [Planomonospora algeriensis]